MKCPICNKEVETYYESSVREPFKHTHPFIGLMMYGPYSAAKEVLCQNDDYVHFEFVPNNTERLVKLGVENSITENEFFEGMNDYQPEDDYEEDEDDEWEDEWEDDEDELDDLTF